MGNDLEFDGQRFGLNVKAVLIGLVGTGGFGRVVMPFAKIQIAKMEKDFPSIDFQTVFVETTPIKNVVNGHRVLSEDEFFNSLADVKFFNVAIAGSLTREAVVNRFLENGCKPISLSAPSTVVYDNNEIGEGAIVCDRCVITSNAKIGKYFHANIFSYVEHDCEIGDFVTFAPGASCNGNVKIGDHAYIGSNAVIKQGVLGNPLVIGEGAIVGMGAVVTKDVAPFTTVVGNPAKPMGEKK